MCDDHHGTELSLPRSDGTMNPVGVDSCIAQLVWVLNATGFRTIASCCGHGRQPPNVILADGRWLFIAPNHEAAHRVASHFPPICDDPGHPQNDLAPIGASDGS